VQVTPNGAQLCTAEVEQCQFQHAPHIMLLALLLLLLLILLMPGPAGAPWFTAGTAAGLVQVVCDLACRHPATPRPVE
jgi:hypothetical protein